MLDVRSWFLFCYVPRKGPCGGGRRNFSNLGEDVSRRAYVNRAAFGRLSRTMTRLAATLALRLVRSVPVAEEEAGRGPSS